jgi:hypothetical protein
LSLQCLCFLLPSFFRYNLGLALLPWGSEVTG